MASLPDIFSLINRTQPRNACAEGRTRLDEITREKFSR